MPKKINKANGKNPTDEPVQSSQLLGVLVTISFLVLILSAGALFLFALPCKKKEKDDSKHKH